MDRWKLSRRRQIEYGRRRPEETALYRLVYNYRDAFERSWEELFEHEYGALRREVLESFDKYLDCGILLHGAARAECPRCKRSILVAHSCKRRCLCPSCDAKRSLVFAENLVSEVLLPYPQRHVVFTIPKRLRCYFRFDRKLLSSVYTAAWSAWKAYVAEVTSSEGKTAMAASLHTAGDTLSFHPHVHSIALSGVVGSGEVFHALPDPVDTNKLCAMFADRVFGSLLEEGLIDEDTVSNMKSWEHSGFSVYVSEAIEPDSTDSLHFLARYLKRCPISLERLSIDESGGEPVVKYVSYRDDEVTTRKFSPLEFLAELSQHLPLMWEQTTRYFGLYSARTRGARNDDSLKMEASEDHSEESPSKATVSWARGMKKIFQVDPLICPRCGETMKIKAFLSDPREIERLCSNLGVDAWRAPPPFAKASLVA